jgi:hypothetical protein
MTDKYAALLGILAPSGDNGHLGLLLEGKCIKKTPPTTCAAGGDESNGFD